jgi:hypothetical protein
MADGGFAETGHFHTRNETAGTLHGDKNDTRMSSNRIRFIIKASAFGT